jgi:putative oxidoreductase
MSTKVVSLETSRDGALWVVQVLGAVLFFIAGLAKISGDAQVIQTFAAVGIGQWFGYVMGFIEIASAILLLIPALSGIIALLLVPTMIGVTLAHLFVGGNPALPIGILFISTIVALGRKETILRLVRRNDSKSVTGATETVAEVFQTLP